jgi:pimeloyl-ACP methyl ester carboxylesterase
VKGRESVDAHFEALMVLMRQGWGGENAAFRQIFTTAFFPDATHEQARWFNELQRETATPENAAKILSALGDVDVRAELGSVRAPALVMHSRDDNVVPISDGIELASGIPGARFVPLTSKNHLLLAHEPAWERFVGELEAFLGEQSPGSNASG